MIQTRTKDTIQTSRTRVCKVHNNMLVQGMGETRIKKTFQRERFKREREREIREMREREREREIRERERERESKNCVTGSYDWHGDFEEQ